MSGPQRVRRIATAVGLGLFLVGADSPGIPPRQPNDIYSFASVVSAKHVPRDPGPAPAFVAADYAPYTGTGRGALAGEPFVKTSDGRSTSCEGDTVYLYPDTPYVLWMLYKYVYYVYTTNFDSDPAILVGAPSILRRDSADTVVRHAQCAEATNGQFQFTDLPAGDYVATASVRPTITTSSVAIDSQMAITPSGEMAPAYTYGVNHGVGIGDGWILLGGGFRVPSDGRFHVVQESKWYTAAHLSSGNRYDPHMKVLK